MIIDAHLHLPSVKKGESFEDSKKKLLSDLKESKVDYAIVIPDNIHGAPIGDLDTSLKLFEKEKNIFLLGTIDIRIEGKETIDKLDKLMEVGKIKGIKIFPGHDPIYPIDEGLSPLYRLCIKYDYPLVIHTGCNSANPEAAKYNDPKYIVEIAKKYPKLKIVISHYFWPEVEYCYKLTIKLDNIYYDTSALADKEVLEETGEKIMRKFLTNTIEEKPSNVMFGTDYAMCNIKDHINLINSLKISKENKEKVFWKNAVKLYRLKLKIKN
ncbi:MAG: amidohydrolase family protein [archaeon]